MLTASLGLILAIHVQQFDMLREHIRPQIVWVSAIERSIGSFDWS